MIASGSWAFAQENVDKILCVRIMCFTPPKAVCGAADGVKSADFTQMAHCVDCEAEGAKSTDCMKSCTEVQGQLNGLMVHWPAQSSCARAHFWTSSSVRDFLVNSRKEVDEMRAVRRKFILSRKPNPTESVKKRFSMQEHIELPVENLLVRILAKMFEKRKSIVS